MASLPLLEKAPEQGSGWECNTAVGGALWTRAGTRGVGPGHTDGISGGAANDWARLWLEQTWGRDSSSRDEQMGATNVSSVHYNNEGDERGSFTVDRMVDCIASDQKVQ